MDVVVSDRLCEALARDSITFRRADRLEFEEAWAARATTLLFIEPLTRFGTSSPPGPSSLAGLVQAAEAPCVSRLILVTSRGDTDPELRRVRASGVPYLVIRPAPLVDAGGGWHALRGRSVLIPQELAHAAAGALPIEELVAAIAAALEDPEAAGRVEQIEPSSPQVVVRLLERAGARPRVVPRWRARLGRRLGQATLGAAQGQLVFQPSA
jgi:hypothetical protein